MKILFCKISSMKYYKGHCKNDTPINGGKYVALNGFGHEEYNFCPRLFDDSGERKCVGFVEPKSTRSGVNTFHLEKIEGCSTLKNEPMVDDVLVVWCATRALRETTIVGWYNHACVWRKRQDWLLRHEDGSVEKRFYNVLAKASDCVLLPEADRNLKKWWVPSARYTKTYGFGQSMVWYPSEPEAKNYLNELIRNIEHYNEENWLYTYPPE